MYNVDNEFVIKQGWWNTCMADTQLKDHVMREIERPNNDTLARIASSSAPAKAFRHHHADLRAR